MNKSNLLLAIAIVMVVVAGGTVFVKAGTDVPEKPKWVNADGTVDLDKIPDDEKMPYKCWNGKDITLSGKDYKQKSKSEPMPGSEEHSLGVNKMNELRKIHGVVTKDSDGVETVNIDDSNPAIVEVMKKYEAKETPQCQ